MIERLRLNGIPASVDGRRRIEPVGEDGIEDGGVVPRRLEYEEAPKYDELGRAGDVGVMGMDLELRLPLPFTTSCSRINFICLSGPCASKRAPMCGWTYLARERVSQFT